MNAHQLSVTRQSVRRVLSACMRGSVLWCSVFGTALAGGGAPPLPPATVLASLRPADVCIDGSVSVQTSAHIPNTFLMSYAEMMESLPDRHRETLYLGGPKCKVQAQLTLVFDGQEPRLPYTLRLRLLGDTSGKAPVVVWESSLVGIADSVGALENLGAGAEELYLRLLADWRRTHR